MTTEHMFGNEEESTEINLPGVSGCITCHLGTSDYQQKTATVL
jgi:hypothetical protein